MCGRYTITDPEGLDRRFDMTIGDGFRPTYNAAPSQDLPVITETGEGRRLELMHWGFLPVWAKDTKIGYKLINARSESVFDKPMWKRAITNQRCLVPATGFYEWKKLGDGKQLYYIRPHNQPVFAFAGLWSSWRNPEGKTIHSYTILTTSPNKDMEAIHDRMPVILHKDDESDWLNPDMSEPDDIAQYLRPLEDGTLETYQVSKEVNTVRTNDGSLILPINSR